MALLPVLEGLHSAEAFNHAFLTAFLQRVRGIESGSEDLSDSLRGRVIATVFHEPSTRTRLSFEAAALRLGAGVITVADSKSGSGVKGETLEDEARIIGGYADLLVLRDARDGASRLASQTAGVPVVNGGDGRLGHPTQTLVDLYTLYREWGELEGRIVGLMGDLVHGRTARSLAWGLALLGARVLLLPAPGLDWEATFEQRILDRHGYRLSRVRHPLIAAWTGVGEARLLEPQGFVQGSLFNNDVPMLEEIDALYLTRLQDERGARIEGDAYPGVTPEQMRDPLLSQCLLLHPLPRRDELPASLDDDPRARYFQQAHAGPFVRQAVFLAMLGSDRFALPPLTPLPAGREDPSLGQCPNSSCITRSERRVPPWRVVGKRQRLFLCAFCDSLLPVEYAGCRSTRRLHPLHSSAVLRIRPENLRPFKGRDVAREEGYVWAEL